MISKLEVGIPYVTKQGKTVTGIKIQYDYLYCDDRLCRYLESSGPRVIGRLIDADHGEFPEDIDLSLSVKVQPEQLELF